MRLIRCYGGGKAKSENKKPHKGQEPFKGLTVQLIHVVLAGHQRIEDDTNGAPDPMHLHRTSSIVVDRRVEPACT